jgi:hypothetical protein
MRIATGFGLQKDNKGFILSRRVVSVLMKDNEILGRDKSGDEPNFPLPYQKLNRANNI